MNKRKDFSILKWIIFPLNSIVLAAIIAWFNLSVFGFEDGLPYTAIVALIGVFSILINKYTESDNRTLARAAFCFEIALTAALIVNAAYSISVQRKMSVARMGETSQKETITEIGKLRGSRTQRAALEKMEKRESAQSIFGDVERTLFWIMICELGLYAISAFSLFAVAKLMDDSPKPAPADEPFPAELDVEKRSPTRRPNLTPKTTTSGDTIDDTRNQQKTTPDDTHPGFKRLREALRLINFEHPPGHFKVDLSKKSDYLIIRHMESRRGDEYTTHSCRAKLSLLDDAVTMPRAAFRERLERFLVQNGFEL